MPARLPSLFARIVPRRTTAGLVFPRNWPGLNQIPAPSAPVLFFCPSRVFQFCERECKFDRTPGEQTIYSDVPQLDPHDRTASLVPGTYFDSNFTLELPGDRLDFLKPSCSGSESGPLRFRVIYDSIRQLNRFHRQLPGEVLVERSWKWNSGVSEFDMFADSSVVLREVWSMCFDWSIGTM